MNNIIMRKIVLTVECQPLSPVQLVASVEIAARTENYDDVIFQGDDGSEVPWVPGEFHLFQRVDLSAIQVKGEPDDVVTIVEGTW
jgi:hypothetical protein